ncbi:MAG: hypothetical protein KatS3mg105_3686 [Gemmatales bacterium]|nr:MAG: hypothetical protein KatS3mg105_3686 [Gemmatales bacterium]
MAVREGRLLELFVGQLADSGHARKADSFTPTTFLFIRYHDYRIHRRRRSVRIRPPDDDIRLAVIGGDEKDFLHLRSQQETASILRHSAVGDPASLSHRGTLGQFSPGCLLLSSSATGSDEQPGSSIPSEMTHDKNDTFLNMGLVRKRRTCERIVRPKPKATINLASSFDTQALLRISYGCSFFVSEPAPSPCSTFKRSASCWRRSSSVSSTGYRF